MLSNESVLYILCSAFHTQLLAFKAIESLSGSHKMPIKINGQELSAKSFVLGKRGRQRELGVSALFTEMSPASQHTRETSTRFRKLLSPGLSLIQNHLQEKVSMYETVQSRTKIKQKTQTTKKERRKKILARNFHCPVISNVKGNFENYDLLVEMSNSFVKSWIERQNFCHLFSLNAEHCTLSRAEQDLPLHH